MEIKLISDIFPDSLTNSYFFEHIVASVFLPSEQYPAGSLAIDYFIERSGSKVASPFLLRLLADSEVVTLSITEQIASVLLARFGENWKKLYATVSAEYNPIHNYNMTETINRDLQGEKKNTNTGTATDTTTPNLSNTTDEFIYGFNSENEQPSSKRTTTYGGSSTNSRTGNYTDDGTNHDVENITRTRSGNIGVTTSQQMLQQERELWRWNFVEQMFKDIDSVLTLRVYDTCRV